MYILLMGPPGAGKGTQAAVISRELGIPAISTGNILRAAIQEGTPTGMKAKTYMDEGHLVPDEVIIGIITERLAESDCAKGYILDGVPRTIAQAEALEAAGIRFDHVVSLEVSDETIEERMSGRRVCEHCGAPLVIVTTSRGPWKLCPNFDCPGKEKDEDGKAKGAKKTARKTAAKKSTAKKTTAKKSTKSAE